MPVDKAFVEDRFLVVMGGSRLLGVGRLGEARVRALARVTGLVCHSPIPRSCRLLNPNLYIGHNVEIGKNVTFAGRARLVVEDGCIIGDGVTISSVTAPGELAQDVPGLVLHAPVHLAAGTVVAAGVTIAGVAR